MTFLKRAFGSQLDLAGGYSSLTLYYNTIDVIIITFSFFTQIKGCLGSHGDRSDAKLMSRGPVVVVALSAVIIATRAATAGGRVLQRNGGLMMSKKPTSSSV